ncbi:MAG TPA: GntG family PLP-dependent aldolase [Propionibacteriaceae bacterium]|nr:GntG family PLP-dependent aldolase [Propionibacteriaceae bacterium]
MIDLRSDTVTRPGRAMREAMAAAEVGDDVYGEDPTVIALEKRVAELLGHEAGLFCPTGSMGNLLGVWLLTRPGSEVLCDAQAHIVRAEMAAHASLHGVTTRTFPSVRGRLDPDAVTSMLSIGTGPFLTETSVVEVENTHNFGGGSVQSLGALQELRTRCDAVGVAIHLDGARLANAHVATGVSFAAYGAVADTVSFCLSKGLGAPVGSVLVSTAENIARARIQRKRLGGGWRQAGILAAAGLYALDHHVERLADDHEAARAFARAVSERVPSAVELADVETNIVVVDTGCAPAAQVVAAAREAGVALSAVGAHQVRAVTHLDVSHDDCVHAGETLGAVLA